jgi:hypothetical protein
MKVNDTADSTNKLNTHVEIDPNIQKSILEK